MIDSDGGTISPRYEVVQRDGHHYQLWKADCILETDNRADCQQWAAMLLQQQQTGTPS